MEDALVPQAEKDFIRENNCLNPCFNGRCTRTLSRIYEDFSAYLVLILVLMEDALVHYNKNMKGEQEKMS